MLKIRNSKPEIRNKSEFSNDQNSKPFCTFGFMILNFFRISCFDIRIYFLIRSMELFLGRNADDMIIT